MCKEFSAIGIKDPEYHIDVFIMKATVCARILGDIEKKTTFIGQEKGKKGQENILALIEENPHISITAIAGKCGLSTKTVRNIINDLRNNNILIRIGPDRGGYWKII